MAWAEQVCNTRQHAETGQTPIDRFTSQGPLQPVEPSLLREAFRWSVLRGVTTTAAVSLAGNRYSVDPSLIGRRVELRFDPEDLTRLDVVWEGRPVGVAVPFVIGRHVHHQVPQAQSPTPPPSPASITWAWSSPRTRSSCSANSRIESCRLWRRRSNNEPRAVGQPLWIHAHTFSKTIPAAQLSDRASHQEAVARIRFCISESLLGVITGEVGVGKTVAVRAATGQLDATAHHIIYVATPTFGARGLYLTIVHALGAKPRAQKADLIVQTQTLLAAEEHERRRRVVVIIDEAHLLAPEQLEELRLLTNAEMDSQSPFALLLVGQPTLARQLRLGILAALDQRIATRYQLAPMDLAEAAQYLRHHLALVGRTDPLFADDAVARLHKLSLGLPRALTTRPLPR